MIRYDKTVSAPTLQHTARLMAELMPGVDKLRILRSWAGVIEATPDGYPIVDAPGRPRGFITASGFTGIGFGMGPATGKVASELALTGTTTADILRDKLAAAFHPDYLEVVDESEAHRGHAGWREGGGTHFRVVMRAAAFNGVSRVERSRAVHRALAEELAGGLHALALDLDGT